MSVLTESNKKPWNQDGYLYLFNEINDPNGRWRLTRESFHRILDIFELKKESVPFDYFRFVVYNTLSMCVSQNFFFLISKLNSNKKFRKYKAYEENFSYISYDNPESLRNFYNNMIYEKITYYKTFFFTNKDFSTITKVIRFSDIIEFVYIFLLDYILLMFFYRFNLSEEKKVSNEISFGNCKKRYSRICEGMFKYYGRPYMNIDAELFDEIQRSIVIKEDFNRDWLESIEQDLKNFIAETLGNIHLRSLVQGPLRPPAKEQMTHFFLQKGILHHAGIPWTDYDYLLFAWDIMFTKTPQEYYKTTFPNGIEYSRIVEKSEYVFPGETIEFIAETPLDELEYDFTHVDSDKIEEWRFFLSRLPQEQKQQLNLMVSFHLDETFDKKLSQFIAHMQHPEILTDIVMEASEERKYLTPRRLPDNINWERYDELFPGDD